MIKRSHCELNYPDDFGQVVHIRAFVTKRYNLVLFKGSGAV